MKNGSDRLSLKAMLDTGRTVMAPGAFDALSAKLAARAGVDAVYMTGFGVAGSSLGAPDIGLMTATEMADRARAMSAAAGDVPLIADGDNGHGGTLNVERLVGLYESAGVQAIQLEDQVFPKRCGHMDSKEVIDRSEAAEKIAAAVDARRSSDFLVIARTDARAVIDFDEAMRRGEDFLAAGADLLFIEAPQSLDEMTTITKHFAGTRLVANMVEDGKTPYLTVEALSELGFALALYPVSALLAVSRLLDEVYRAMQTHGQLPDNVARFSFSGYNSAIGLDQLLPTAIGSPKHALKMADGGLQRL